MKNIFTTSLFTISTLATLLFAMDSPAWGSNSDTFDEETITRIPSSGNDFEHNEEEKDRIQELSHLSIAKLLNTKPTTEKTDKKILKIIKDSKTSKHYSLFGTGTIGYIDTTQYGQILETLSDGLKEEAENQGIIYDFTAPESMIFSDFYRNEFFEIIKQVSHWTKCECIDLEKMHTILKYAPSTKENLKETNSSYLALISRYKKFLTSNIFIERTL